MPSVSMRQMLEAGVHFGHQTRFWNPKMAPFIFGERNRIHIINLEKTQPLYSGGANFVKGVVADGGKVLFVGTKRSAREAIQEEAERAAACRYVNQRWLGGMLTNFKTIRQSIKRLTELDELRRHRRAREARQEGSAQLRREMDKLERSLGGIKDMESLPGCAVRHRRRPREHRRARGQEARHPGRRGRRHQLLPGRHRLRDPGQR